MGWQHAEQLLAAAREVYGELKNHCVWVKDNAGMGSLYRGQHELVFVFKHGRNDHRTMSNAATLAAIAPTYGSIPAPTPPPRCGEEGNLLALLS